LVLFSLLSRRAKNQTKLASLLFELAVFSHFFY